MLENLSTLSEGKMPASYIMYILLGDTEMALDGQLLSPAHDPFHIASFQMGRDAEAGDFNFWQLRHKNRST